MNPNFFLTSCAPFRAERPPRRWLLAAMFLAGQTALHAQTSVKTQTQIEAIQQEAAARTPAQKKINSQLLHASRLATTGAAVDGAPALRANVHAETDGRYKVKITAAVPTSC